MTSQGGSKAHTLQTSSVVDPPLPIEEDLAKASAWDDEDTSTLVSSKWKGKGRQRDDDDDDDDRTVNGDRMQSDSGEYPPIAEEELESRKIEQVNLLSMPLMHVAHTRRPVEPQTMGNSREATSKKVT